MNELLALWAGISTLTAFYTTYMAYKYRKLVDDEYLMTRDSEGRFKVLNSGE